MYNGSLKQGVVCMGYMYSSYIETIISIFSTDIFITHFQSNLSELTPVVKLLFYMSIIITINV